MPKATDAQPKEPDAPEEPASSLVEPETNPRTVEATGANGPSEDNDDDVPASSGDVKIEGVFASKMTPRITTIMADGIAFIRGIAEDIIQEVTLKDTAPVITLAMRLAEWAEDRLRAFEGAEKKKLVLNLLLWTIRNQEDILNNALGDNEEELYRLVRDVVPSVLNAVCAAAKGKLAINHMVKVSSSCFGWCLGKQSG